MGQCEGIQQSLVCLIKYKFLRVSGGFMMINHVSLETRFLRERIPSLLPLGGEKEAFCSAFLCGF